MGNDVHWWKDRDEWMPPLSNDTPPRLDSEEEQAEVPIEDAGDVANDDSYDEDPDLPHRGPED
jgi:hypothetical protein